MNETTDLTELNLIFQKINAQSKKSGDHEQRLSLYEFYLACQLIAHRIYPGKELEECCGVHIMLSLCRGLCTSGGRLKK